ncbi:hypothetical protein SmJEL517_g05796 [Synchytrium microbalum]|uniref:SRA1/Sec31 domain-containing protein n=1 Tax=Synchytrium microbalum TaxID=1806994 RepID=A0A507BYA6_9FUNG|nr:uncharacterized protein SmJEL517_g05796 [Synchytrium microbalum]TPX30706.1 hypothetical protein SmJEL517_g05796 [Synchytrium microbalum]
MVSEQTSTDIRSAAIPAKSYQQSGPSTHWNDLPPDLFLSHKKQKSVQPTNDDEKVEPSRVASLCQMAMRVCKASMSDNAQMRMLADTEKRLDVLYERLDKLDEVTLDRVCRICYAFETHSCLLAAQQLAVTLVASSMANEGRWVVGFKRLVDSYKLVVETQSTSQSTPSS